MQAFLRKLNIAILMLTLACLTNSCKKDHLHELQKTPYLGSELRIDGYYYYSWDDQGITQYSIVVFYRDGTMLRPTIASDKNGSLAEIESEINTGNLYASNSERKSSWGVYNVLNDSIATSKWFPVFLGGHQTALSGGNIINDSTFEITSHENFKGGLSPETYYFRQFSPKPDSTNSFL